MRTGGPKDPKGGVGPKQVEHQDRVDARREVANERDRFDKKKGSVEDRQKRLEAHDASRPVPGLLIAQVLTRTERKLGKLRDKADAVLAMLGDFAPDAIALFGKRLDRIRGQMDDSRRRHHAQTRSMWEVQAGLTELDESRLSLAGEKLGSIDSLVALLALIAELGNGSSAPRRLVVRGADRRAALDYAASANPTTVYLDVPFLALGLFDPDRIDGELGRTLGGQRVLEVAGGR